MAEKLVFWQYGKRKVQARGNGEPPIKTILTDTLRVGVASALAE